MIETKPQLRVLSLFDGISCAQVALEALGYDLRYCASETDKHSIAITQKNFPNTTQLDDVQKLSFKFVSKLDEGYLKKLFTFDLLIGGSPCQDLSVAKSGREGLKGSRSKLFFEYLRILKELKPKWFVLENVASMSKESRDEISKHLGVEPIMIDAALVSAQSRKRLFWTNIPGIQQPEDRGIMLKDIIEDGYSKDEKSRTLTKSYKNGPEFSKLGTHREKTMVFNKPVQIGMKAKGMSGRIYSTEGKSVTLKAGGGGSGAKTGLYKILPDGKLKVKEPTKKGYAIAEEGDSVDVSFPNSKTRRGRVGKKAKNLMTSSSICVYTKGDVRPLYPIECERLQGLPDNYTEGIPKTHRIRALGDAFNVEVVKHILSYIPKK